MNVFNIQKQCDRWLKYTNHAIERAEERKVPMPSYIPLNTELSSYDLNNGEASYTLNFKYLGMKYALVVTDELVVLTVYRMSEPKTTERKITRKEALKQYQRVLRSNKSEEYYTFKDGKYPHLEVEIGYEFYGSA